MTRKPVEDLVVGAARGEPMDVEERERLAAVLAGSPELEAASRAQEALTADLVALRAALAARSAPVGVEEEQQLRKAFRAARASRPRRRQARPWALAVPGVAIAATLIMVVAIDRPGSGPVRVGAPASNAERAALAAGNTADAAGQPSSAAGAAAPDASEPAVFHALPYGPGLMLGGSYSIVRVRIPLAAFAAGQAGGVEASVEADLLVGDDGIPSAIRFADGGTLLVSTNSQ